MADATEAIEDEEDLIVATEAKKKCFRQRARIADSLVKFLLNQEAIAQSIVESVSKNKKMVIHDLVVETEAVLVLAKRKCLPQPATTVEILVRFHFVQPEKSPCTAKTVLAKWEVDQGLAIKASNHLANLTLPLN